jgi:flagellar hook-length control protein FliK
MAAVTITSLPVVPTVAKVSASPSPFRGAASASDFRHLLEQARERKDYDVTGTAAGKEPDSSGTVAVKAANQTATAVKSQARAEAAEEAAKTRQAGSEGSPDGTVITGENTDLKMQIEAQEVFDLKQEIVGRQAGSAKLNLDGMVARIALDQVGAKPETVKVPEIPVNRTSAPDLPPVPRIKSDSVSGHTETSDDPASGGKVKSEASRQERPAETASAARSSTDIKPQLQPNPTAVVELAARQAGPVATVPRPAVLSDSFIQLRDQVLSRVETGILLLAEKGQQVVTIRLQPPELGKVQIELLMRDSRMEIKINAENQTVREVILSNLDQLKSNVESGGQQVESMRVDVGDFRNSFQDDRQATRTVSAAGGSGGGAEDGRSGGGGGLPDSSALLLSFTPYLGRSVNLIV